MTGTNGKTTTVRMISHILRGTGRMGDDLDGRYLRRQPPDPQGRRVGAEVGSDGPGAPAG
ncbi:MAG: hypothetical protein JO272_02695 [Pseudonocardiales bacterium]|nr:hypothetical protein [Pseudonocardiales bacterium]